MSKDTKRIAIGLGVVGAAGAAAYFISKKVKAEEPPPDEEGATISIEILDAQGNPVPHNSPATLEEGKTYTVKVKVTNRSTLAGAPSAANLITWIEVWVGPPKQWLLGPVERTDSYNANQTRTHSWSFTIPMGLYAGFSGPYGFITAQVFSPVGVSLANAVEDIFLKAPVTIVYDATVAIGF